MFQLEKIQRAMSSGAGTITLANSALKSGEPLHAKQADAPPGLAIVHVVRQFHPGMGGLENFVEQLAMHQRAHGHAVTIVTLDRIFDDPTEQRLAPIEILNGVKIERVPFRGSVRYPIAPRVLGSIKHADIVHVHAVDFFCDFLAATAWLYRKPLILSTHGGFFHTPFLRNFKRLFFNVVTRASISQYAAVIACSEEDYRTFAPIARSRLTLIPNAVDIDKFEGLADPSSRTLIYFGRLAPNKQVVRLIDWFAGLSRRGDWRLIIAGKATGVGVAELINQTQVAGISSRVEIYDAPTRDDLLQLISRSGSYCCASSYEGFGLAAIEGASAGLYPVLSDIPAFRESVRRLGFGILVDFENPSSWTSSYDLFERSFAAFRASFSKEQIKHQVSQFGWREAADQFEAVYMRVLGRSKRRVGRVAIDVLDEDSAIATILENAANERSRMFTFCNAHTVNLATSDSNLRQALQDAIVLNDGIGVDVASRTLFGTPFPSNLNGTDLIPKLLASTELPLRVYFLGGKPGVAKAAAREAARRYPGMTVAGTCHGYFDAVHAASVVRNIQRSKANLILVAMGQPRQEIWASENFRQFNGPVICVGALFDFLAGEVSRAPSWMRQRRIEWVFRLLNEPRRLGKRYLIGNAVFLMRVVRQRWFGTRL